MSQKNILSVAVALLVLLGIFYLDHLYGTPKNNKVFYENISYSTNSYIPYATKFFYDSFQKNSKKGFEVNSKGISKYAYIYDSLQNQIDEQFLQTEEAAESISNDETLADSSKILTDSTAADVVNTPDSANVTEEAYSDTINDITEQAETDIFFYKTDYTGTTYTDSSKLMLVVSPYFLPTRKETEQLFAFVSAGNHLFVSAFTVSSSFVNALVNANDTKQSFHFFDNYPPLKTNDQLHILPQSNTGLITSYQYPGSNPKNIFGFKIKEDSLVTAIYRQANSHVSLLKIKHGKGHVFLNFTPITLSNYFLLHKGNFQYFNDLYQVLGAKNRQVIWDDFYKNHTVQRPEPNFDSPGKSYFWQIVSQYPSLKWAIGLFLFSILLFVLNHMRSILKPIAVLPNAQNNSLNFTKAIAALYWQNQDHKIIAEKKIHQFYDFIQQHYKINHSDFQQNHPEKIANKMGLPADEVLVLQKLIAETEQAANISKEALHNINRKITNILTKK
jgi:hypothetical protein